MQEIKVKELKIDDELRDLLPPLSKDEFEGLEKLIVSDGKLFSPIIIWQGYIVDGHNRYKICKKHNIDFSKNIVSLECKNKDDVKSWILYTHLKRRNLSPAQRVIVAEKYRDLYEKMAKENLRNAKLISKTPINTRKELAKIAGVSEDTYSKAIKILNSDNEELKQEIISGEKKINTAYNELTGKNKKIPKLYKINNRKPIPSITIKHLVSRSNSKCEICNWGGNGLEGILIPHHIHKYADTEDNSLNNLILTCPNCHNIIHMIETCNDNQIVDIIYKNIDKDNAIKIKKYVDKLKMD